MFTTRIKPLLKASLLALTIATVGLSQSLPNKQRNSLLLALKGSQLDTNRINILLDLGQYYLDKPFDLQADVDSATAYMKQAERLSNKLDRKGNKATAHHIDVLLKMGAFYLFKPLELKPDMDTAMLYAKQAEQLSLLHQPSLLANSLELLGSLCWETRDTLQAKNYFFKAIKQYEYHRDTARLASIWFAFGEHYPHSKKNLTQKINCYKQALAYYHHLKNQFRELEVLDYMYYTFMLQQRTDIALVELQKILQLYEAHKYVLTDLIYLMMSAAELTQGNYHVAMQYNLKSLQLALANNQLSRIGENYYHLGKICFFMNEDDKRLDYYNKALYYYKKANDLNQIHSIAREICGILIKKKKGAEAFSFYRNIIRQYPPTIDGLKRQTYQTLAQLYEAIKQYDRAESYYLQSLDLLKGISEQDLIKRGIYSSVGKFYLSQKQYTKARYYFTRLLSTSSPNKNAKEIQVNHYNLFKLDSTQGNFQSALAHLQQYISLKDSTLTATKAKQIEELEIRFETQIKEQRIDLLTAQAREQQIRIQQATLTRNVTFGGTTMLLILLGLIYNRYRLKQMQQVQIQQKNHALEELVNQKEWLVKEIHHRVKNNLQLIISLLQSQGRYLLDKAAISAIEQSEHRVRAMALIHQKLYRTENLSQINMPAYIQEVAQQLSDSFDPQKRITLQYAIAPLELDVSQAIPLGLIINEAITNAFKYAFPNDQAGTIHLSLTCIEGDQYVLRVKDNGVGLSADVDLSKNKSMGANIMRRLSKQLGGIMQVERHLGVEISIVFTLYHPHFSISYAA